MRLFSYGLPPRGDSPQRETDKAGTCQNWFSERHVINIGTLLVFRAENSGVGGFNGEHEGRAKKAFARLRINDFQV